MKIANRLVEAVLASPLHRVLCGSTAVIRYTGCPSSTRYSTPVQYARHGDDVLVFIGRPETKTWCPNFSTRHDAEVLPTRRGESMAGTAVVGADEADSTGDLLAVYLARFPKAAKSLAHAGARAVGAGLVVFEPRLGAALIG